MMAASAADIPGASDSRHRKIQAGNRLRSVAQRVRHCKKHQHIGSHRAAWQSICIEGVRRSTNEIGRPLLALFCQATRSNSAAAILLSSAIQSRGSVSFRSRSIATAARFASLSGNGSLARLPTRAIDRCLAPPGQADLHQRTRHLILSGLSYPGGAGVDLGEGRDDLRTAFLGSVTPCSA